MNVGTRRIEEIVHDVRQQYMQAAGSLCEDYREAAWRFGPELGIVALRWGGDAEAYEAERNRLLGSFSRQVRSAFDRYYLASVNRVCGNNAEYHPELRQALSDLYAVSGDLAEKIQKAVLANPDKVEDVLKAAKEEFEFVFKDLMVAEPAMGG